MARECFLQKMGNMGLDENIVQWTDSFMRDRRVIASVDSQDEAREVITSLPQGSPISPVLCHLHRRNSRGGGTTN